MGFPAGGRFDTLDGAHSRGFLRVVLLEALRENPRSERPKILPDLFKRCLPAFRAVAEMAEQRQGSPRLSWSHIEAAHELVAAWETRSRKFPGEAWTTNRLQRAKAVAELRDRLIEWGTCYRLTSGDGKRNRWVLDTAVRTLETWLATECAGGSDAQSDGLGWHPSGFSYSQPFTLAEREVWNPLTETKATAVTRLRAAGLSRDEARRRVEEVLINARERWQRQDRERARAPIVATRPQPAEPGPPAEQNRALLIRQGFEETEARILGRLMEAGYSLAEAQDIQAELAEKHAVTPLPEAPQRDRIRPAHAFRTARNHYQPSDHSNLGPLARDYVWLAAAVATPERDYRTYSGRTTQENVIQRIQAAAEAAGFELPSPLFTSDYPRWTSTLRPRH